MRRTILFTNLVFTGALLVMTGGALAQAPNGSPSQMPQTPSSMQRPGTDTPPGDSTTTATASKVDDKRFVKEAAMGGLAEVEMGKLAAQKASSDDVKQFAQKMVDDHTKANDQLKEVAAHDNIAIPNSIGPKDQARIDKLSKLSGAAFDKAYVKEQLKDHKEDVAKFKAEAQNGSDASVKTFASNTLPTLEQHLEQVKNLHKTEKS